MSVFSNNLLLGAGGQSTGPAPFDPTLIGNSVWLDGSADYLSKTPGSTGNQKRFTFAFWIQRHKFTEVAPGIYSAGDGTQNNDFNIYWNNSGGGGQAGDTLCVSQINGGGVGWRIFTSQLFRDIGWYHFIISIDTAESIASDRVKIYLNGDEITSFASASYPSLNADVDYVNDSANEQRIGRNQGSNYINGSLSQYLFLDGNSIQNGDVAVTDFLDAFTYGTNGSQFSPKSDADIAALATTAGGNSFCLDFANSTNLGASISSIDNSVGSGATMPGATGTNIGNMTGNGGLAAAFDDTHHTSSGTSANVSGTEGYVGKNWNGRSTIIDSVSIFPPDTYTGKFFRGSSEGQLRLYGSNSAPSSGTDGTLLADSGVISTTGFGSSNAFSFSSSDITTTTAYTYHWMTLTDTVSHDIYVGQLDWTATKVFNDFTPTSMSAANQTTHTPSLQFPVLNALNGDATLVSSLGYGNRLAVGVGSWDSVFATKSMGSSGKYYYEVRMHTETGQNGFIAGIHEENTTSKNWASYIGNTTSTYGLGYSLYTSVNGFYTNGSPTVITGYTSNLVVGDIVMMAVDLDNNKLYWGVNGTFFNSGDPANGTGETTTIQADTEYVFGLSPSSSEDYFVNFGQDSTFGGGTTAGGNADANGVGNFKYTVPTGFQCLASSSLTAPDYQGIDYFDSTLYEGNGTGQRVGDFVPFTDAFNVANSAMFQHDDVRALKRTAGTPSSSGGKKGTWSTWYKTGVIDTDNIFFDTGTTATNRFSLQMDASGQIFFYHGGAGFSTSADLKGGGLWRNVVLKVDTSQSTATDRARIYIDGVEVTSFATDNRASITQDSEIGYMDSGATQFVGSYNGVTANQWDGYLAETIFLDNQFLSADSFGQLDTSTNKWVPKDISGLTLGDQGFYLAYGGNFGTGNGAGDSTGNSNNLTEIGTWSTSDQFTDTPSNNVFTFATDGTGTISEGNTRVDLNNSVYGLRPAIANFPSTGKFYGEFLVNAVSGSTVGIGYARDIDSQDTTNPSTTPNNDNRNFLLQLSDGNKINGDSTGVSYGSGITAGQTAMWAFDAATRKIWFGSEGTFFASGDPAAGTNEAFILPNTGTVTLVAYDGSNARTANLTMRNATAAFEHTAPTGFTPFTQDNLDDTASKITAWAWIKNRDAADSHILVDRVRGVGEVLHSNDASAETTEPNTVQRFLQRGVQVGSDVQVNTANESYVLWQWLMGDSATTGTVNNDGSIASTLIAADAGHLSIGTYTGTGANATVGHGLGGTPEFFTVFKLGGADHQTWQSSLPGTDHLILNTTAAAAAASLWNSSTPTSTVINLGSHPDVNQSGQGYFFIAFRSIPGVCKVGSYTGAGVVTNNAFVHCGFKPAFVMVKDVGTAGSWRIHDSARSPANPSSESLQADNNAAEITSNDIDILADGFKIRSSNSEWGGTNTHIYLTMADIAGNGTLPPVYGR